MNDIAATCNPREMWIVCTEALGRPQPTATKVLLLHLLSQGASGCTHEHWRQKLTITDTPLLLPPRRPPPPALQCCEGFQRARARGSYEAGSLSPRLCSGPRTSVPAAMMMKKMNPTRWTKR